MLGPLLSFSCLLLFNQRVLIGEPVVCLWWHFLDPCMPGPHSVHTEIVRIIPSLQVGKLRPQRGEVTT